MTQIIAAQDVTLRSLKQDFGLQLTDDADFFPEWRSPQLSLSHLEQQLLDRVKQNFQTLLEDPPLLEDGVKMVVLAPLLDLAGFYQKPFRIQTESRIEITAEDQGAIVRGRIDVLVLHDRLWVLVIESKRSDFSALRAIPQALAYLLANPQGDRPSYGLITTGNEFLFLKTDGISKRYANSRLFSLLNPGNELYDVLQILRSLGATLQPARS